MTDGWDVFNGWIAHLLVSMPDASVLLNLTFLIAVLWFFIKIVNNEKNSMEWTDLISTKGQDGKLYADWNKIGQGLGAMVAVWLPFIYAHSEKVDATGLAAIMGVSLAYLGGVSSYAATLRTKQAMNKDDK